MRLWRNLSLSLKVPLLVAALMIAVAVIASQLVLTTLEDQQVARIRELARLVQTYNQMVGEIAANADTRRRMAERERYVSLGRLSSSLAHEINNPLGGLLNATDTIEKFSDRPDVVRKSTGFLSRGLKHLRDITKATLDANRFARSDEPLEAEDFEDLKLLINPEIRRGGQRLGWHVDLGYGFATTLTGAPVRQIALNLLLNATAAAGPGGQVGLRVWADEKELVLEVADSGPGLSESAEIRLLEGGPAPASGGVGLRVVRELAQSLGGRITCGRRNEATVIEIGLPLSCPQVAPC